MKIAISGTHGSGKTTLVDSLSRSLPGYDAVEEPYYLLEAQGHQIATPPSVEDFEAQLACSITCVERGARDTIFDRCPVDFLAYLLVGRPSREAELDRWIPRVRQALGQLDQIVFVPLEEPDRTGGAHIEHPGLRRRMDQRLRELLQDDPWAFGAAVFEVRGSPAERTQQVLDHLGLA
jgi:GTPase SAR1 family protein